ncbi:MULTISPECIES: hypothetical protein [Snodgrassella]|uniref:hypothetical protein n=1 Tax=Snodgrassella TaxID=1193515 RepID=UPI000A05CA82|nr:MULTISPECIES: hypothetical protein [Snodgrassella]MBI0098178.1 hypothetical protein [Snodgrassella sp. W8134]MBI0101986.1 hypothetical protein [Snodgrassella sp. W8135]MBI0129848.1 hypothetical protein [Snodgrassella sp. W8124]MBI0133320.1 hypothetical protein [Snodgrassella sp. W8132]MCT6883363.1 hypothetical protein [Snodgrassella alvi]
MNKSMRNSLIFAIGLVVAAGVSAKEIKVASNNTAYAPEEVQKLANTAVKMGVKEPLNMNVASGNLIVTGSSDTKCIFKVGTAKTPQISGISCK